MDLDARSWSRRSLVVALIVALGAVGCGRSDSPAPAPAQPDPPAAPSAPPPEAPPSAPPEAPPSAPPEAPPSAPPEAPPSAPPEAPPSAPPTAAGPAEDASYLATASAAAVLLNFNAPGNFGGGALTSGFTPDPWPYTLTAGSGVDAIDVATLNIHDDLTRQPCTRSYVTRRPDFHFTFAAGTSFPLIRFYVVTSNGADATLLINQPNGRWRCNDDHGHGDWTNALMPAIDFANPPSGRYDIWVGSFDASARNPATLFITELSSNHP